MAETRKYTKYTKAIHNKIVDAFREEYYTVRQVCKIVNICEYTYYKWIQDHPKLADDIEEACTAKRGITIEKAERSLGKCLTGYEYEETKTIRKKDEDGKWQDVTQEVYRKHVKPNPNLIIFALINLAADKWQNHNNVMNINSEGDVSINYDKLDVEEAKKLDALIEKVNIGD